MPKDQQIFDVLSGFVPSVVGAILLLVAGWILATASARGIRIGVRRARLIERTGRWVSGSDPGEKASIERWLGRIVFAVVMLFVLVGFSRILGLSAVSEPITRFLNDFYNYAPRLIGPALLLIVAWLVATAMRVVVKRAFTVMRLDDRLSSAALAGEQRRPSTAETLSEAVYWLTFLIFLPAVLGALHLGILLEPVRGVIDKLLGYMPSLIGAAAILVIGWTVAHIIRKIVVNLLVAVGTDKLPHHAGLQSAFHDQQLSALVGLVVYALILIPVLIASLQALRLEAVTQPATDMLRSFLAAVPAVFGAALVLGIAYIIARVLGSLVANLLEGIGFDQLSSRLGIGDLTVGDKTTPSAVVGYLMVVGVMLFAVIEAMRLLGFSKLAELGAEFLIFAGNVVLGLFIIALGLFVANLIAQAVRSSSIPQAGMLSAVARVAILILAFAMGLQQMGIASEIILLAFGLMLGAITVAAALAFGLGSRDIAARALEEWIESLSAKHRGKAAADK
jgi:hypothetical protein